MDDLVNRLARELADSIARAVAEDPKVEACREKARAAGYELRVTLEAVVGFISRQPASTGSKRSVRAQTSTRPRAAELSASDRRFLRSLRIAADEPKEVDQ